MVLLRLRPRPTPWTGCPHVQSCRTINSTSLERRAAWPPWSRCFCRFYRLVWCCGSLLVTSRDCCMLIAVGTKKLKEGLGMLPSGPPWPAPHPLTKMVVHTGMGLPNQLRTRRVLQGCIWDFLQLPKLIPQWLSLSEKLPALENAQERLQRSA
jgi:hypothetical protein